MSRSALKPIYVAILWHFHQPVYKDPYTSKFILPWTRTRAVKDYDMMGKLIENHPDLKATINFVPSLLMQIENYNQGLTDLHMDLTLKNAADLSLEDKRFILNNFFPRDSRNLIDSYPRFRELENLSEYSEQEIRDIQAWFNLAWFNPSYKYQDPQIKNLFLKGRDFSEEEKRLVIEKQKEIMTQILPRYKKLAVQGQIEISLTPFYHPILPLLGCLLEGEDLSTQVKKSQDFHLNLFGEELKTMWPSEGAVCQKMIRAVSRRGIANIATDESILRHSLYLQNRRPLEWPLTPEEVYTPWVAEIQGNSLRIFFRNNDVFEPDSHKRNFSNLIGFEYKNWGSPEAAAEDLIGRILRIRQKIIDNWPQSNPPLITLALDGENAWEHYPGDNGFRFLEYFYQGLTGDGRIKTTTISEYANQFGAGFKRKLTRLKPGSWINEDFSTWIGNEVANRAWEYLIEARKILAAAPAEKEGLRQAWECLYIAEGSDWFWWYGGQHATANYKSFDKLFRAYLSRIYEILKLAPPPELNDSLYAGRSDWHEENQGVCAAMGKGRG